MVSVAPHSSGDVTNDAYTAPLKTPVRQIIDLLIPTYEIVAAIRSSESLSHTSV